MRELFYGITGQEQTTSYLQHAFETGHTTHAYLIAGGAPDEGADIAMRFAAGILAGDDDDVYEQLLYGSHPDLHVFYPAGAGSYLVEQIRELTRDAGLAPIRAQGKAYIVKDAQRLSGAPANAFLKTLEEPPANITCILLATSEAAVLETVKSRCEVLALNTASIRQKDDTRVFEMLDSLARGCSTRDLLAASKRLVDISVEQAEMLSDEDVDTEAYLEKYDDYLSQGAKKQIEQRGKRETSARERASLLGTLGLTRAWLRDCLIAREGAAQLISYDTHARQTSAVGRSTPTANLLSALDAVQTAASRISYNVTPQLAIEAMFLEIWEALCRR